MQTYGIAQGAPLDGTYRIAQGAPLDGNLNGEEI